MNSSVYKVGLYCRLSLDDGSTNESGSITTQKMMLKKYCIELSYYTKTKEGKKHRRIIIKYKFIDDSL